jgi:hypothetical protein
MKRILSLTGVVLACALTNLSMQTAMAAEESDAPDYHPFTLGFEAGVAFGASLGLEDGVIPELGVAASWRFADHFGGRVGLSGFLLSQNSSDIENNTYNTDARLLSAPLALDIYPWKKSSFRITAGILFNQNELTGTGVADTSVNPQGEYNLNGTFYQAANGVGDLNLTVEQNLVAPYVSIGMNFYLDKQKRWSIGGEVGVAYTGSPDVTLSTSSGAEAGNATLQSDLNAEASAIEDEVWDFYPIVKVSVNYSF